MKKMFIKSLLLTALFSLSGLCIMANESYIHGAEPRGAIHSNNIPDTGDKYYYTDGWAQSYDGGSTLGTKGSGSRNHYFWLYVRDARGNSRADADASNGGTRIAQTNNFGDHSHTCSGALIS